MPNKQSLIVDLDGTLCPIKKPGEHYAELSPYVPMVEKLKALKVKGYRIVIYTARNMRTYNSNLGEINKYTARMTQDWLDLHGIPYDEILFGKPWPGPNGFYIDDKGVRPSEFLQLSEQEIGDILEKSKQILHSDKVLPTVVITMAGAGSRFANAGCKEPKYQIKIKGLPLFYWSMLSLSEFIRAQCRFVFVVKDIENPREFIDYQCHLLGITRYNIATIDHETDGQATSVLFAKPYWSMHDPLLIYNIDTYIEPDVLKIDIPECDGWIPCFYAVGDHWSFVKVEESGFASEVREKERISANCSVGLYWFKSCKMYEEAYLDYYSAPCNIERNEKYIAPLYNHLIAKNYKVTISDLPVKQVHCLGTPEEVVNFKIEK